MSVDHNYPQLAIDHRTFTDALGDGALDICLDYLRQRQIHGAEEARLACRLGEKLFHAGRAGEAIECGRFAFSVVANDNEIAHFCAWLFSNSGCYEEAATAYERLIEHRPDWIEGYRHASSAFAQIGSNERAIAFAIQASDLAPDNFDFAYHAGCMLLDTERVEEANFYLERATAIEPRNPQALRVLSAAAYALDRPDEALSLALQAAALAPEDNGLVIHAAELLLRAGQTAEATALSAVRSPAMRAIRCCGVSSQRPKATATKPMRPWPRLRWRYA